VAITDINLTGYVFQDDGDALEGATVELLETGTTTVEATYSGGTTSAGLWTFTEASLDTTYDLKITSGSSIRKRMWADEITLKTVDVSQAKIRGVNGAAAPLYFFADQAAAPGDAWRIQASASDTLAIGSDKASAGTIIDYLTITNGANAAASTVAIGGALTAVTIDASTDFTVGSLVITDDSIVMTPSAGDTVTIAGAANGILNITTVDAAGTTADVSIDADGEIVIDAADAAGAIFKIAGTAQLSVIDGSILPTTDNDIDLGSSSYQFKDAYINGTLEADAITINGTNVVSGSLITTLGTISAGTWNGTAIATSYIAGDAITGAKIADDAVDSEHYTDGSIDNVHLADDAVGADELAANAVVNASVASGAAIVVSKLALTAGDGLTLNTNDMDLDASLTTVTTLKNTSLVIGRDTDNDIDFATDNKIIFRVSAADEVELVANVLEPVTSDGVALGTTSLMWSDLFLASGSVINFNAGDITLTHSSNTLTVAGGTLAAAAITGTTIDATTDFTIGSTIITDGVITDSSGLQIAANIDLALNTLSNVGASGNNWTSASLTHSGTSLSSVERTSSGTNSRLNVFDISHKTNGNMSAGFGPTLRFLHEDSNSGGKETGKLSFRVEGADDVTDFVLTTFINPSGTTVENDVLKVTSAGVLSVDLGSGTGTDGDHTEIDIFDDYDDPVELQRYTHMQSEKYSTIDERATSFEKMLDMGIISEVPSSSSGYHMNLQPMVRLLAGGIYQNRERIDAQHEAIDERLKRIEAAIGV
jgi:hypothetical protein